MESEKVLIDLDEYKELIISQYENKKLKKSLIEEIEELKETIKKETNILNEILNKKELLITAVIGDSDYYLKNNSREENLNFKRWNSIFNSNSNKYKNLIALGLTEQDLKDYVNNYFDEKEKEEKEGEECTN